jgi:tetratricopeptide (TPR) repeat protein
LEAAARAEGSIVLLVGEPGVGKTRMAEELAAEARAAGSIVLSGRCYDGDWTPPYAPFSEMLDQLATDYSAFISRDALGAGGPVLGRVSARLRDLLSDLGEPGPSAPNEAQFLVLDAMARLITSLSSKSTLVMILDDLHWADLGSLVMLRYVSRSVHGRRLVLIGCYREGEIGREHPLMETVQHLRRETDFDRIVLHGLDEASVGELISASTNRQASPAFLRSLTAETGGNPFFIRETLLHLAEERKLVIENGLWHAASAGHEGLDIPEGVRQLIWGRLLRLSIPARQLLSAASAFNGVFHFEVAAAGADIDHATALASLDEALHAQLICATGIADSYEFTHALIRQTLYEEINPSRQVRLHRRLAEALESSVSAGGGSGKVSAITPAEIAYQYLRSAALPGAERGALWALKAADEAEAGYARERVVDHLLIARQLTPESDPLYPRIIARLGLALPLVSAPGENLPTILEAAKRLASTEGEEAAATYLADACFILGVAGSFAEANEAGAAGIPLAGTRRDSVWVRLMYWNLRHLEQTSPDYLGLSVDHPERHEMAEVLGRLPQRELEELFVLLPVANREEALQSNLPLRRTYLGGALEFGAQEYRGRALSAEAQGRTDQAGMSWAMVARCQLARGDIEGANSAYDRGLALSRKLPGSGMAAAHLFAYRAERAIATNEGWQSLLHEISLAIVQAHPQYAVFLANMRSVQGLAAAACGDNAAALEAVAALQPAIVRAPGWSTNYVAVICDVTATLWLTHSTDCIDTVEQNLREKILMPDFRYPMRDGRLSVARLCALQGRLDEARHWFKEARIALDEQGARPLRVICDYDEALALVRNEGKALRNPGFPAERRKQCERLLQAAIAGFNALGMAGWSLRAESLLA